MEQQPQKPEKKESIEDAVEGIREILAKHNINADDPVVKEFFYALENAEIGSMEAEEETREEETQEAIGGEQETEEEAIYRLIDNYNDIIYRGNPGEKETDEIKRILSELERKYGVTPIIKLGDSIRNCRRDTYSVIPGSNTRAPSERQRNTVAKIERQSFKKDGKMITGPAEIAIYV